MIGRVFRSFADWCAMVSPAPRCRECDRPLDFKQITNDSEMRMGLEDKPLCDDCAVHLFYPHWNGVSSIACQRQPTARQASAALDAVTCGSCKRADETKRYLDNLRELHDGR